MMMMMMMRQMSGQKKSVKEISIEFKGMEIFCIIINQRSILTNAIVYKSIKICVYVI